MKRKLLIAASLVLLAITASYGNFFNTGLHYGDETVVRDNPAIRTLKNIPRFFYDASTASTETDDYMFRPVTTLSLALDYSLGHGAPFFYRLSTFLIYLGGLALIGWFFFIVFERAIPHPWNPYLAIMATALIGLHPAVAELLNPTSQRGELYAALGCVGGIALYGGLPSKRGMGLYLIPPALGILAHPAGLIFGPMLLAFIVLVEPPPTYDEALTEEQVKSRDETQAALAATGTADAQKRIRIPRRKHPFRAYVKAQFKRFMPAFEFTGAAVFLQSVLNPFHVVPESMTEYWFTQPWVATRYFRSFFAPFYLGPASDLAVFTGYDTRAVIGLVFVIALVSVVLLLGISPQWRPTVFGLWWFLIGILPGAILRQQYVESDTRMFLPFIGLALSLTLVARMMLPSGEPLRRLQAIVAAGLLIALGYGTHVRNAVWNSEEALWHDTIEKHPKSVRGLQNYAMVLSSKGQQDRAMQYLFRARELNQEAWEVESHMGTVTAALNRTDEADDHFHMGISLNAAKPICHFLFAVWLETQPNREAEAIDSYVWAESLAPTDLRPRHALMRMFDKQRNWGRLRSEVEAAQPILPDDLETKRFDVILQNHPDSVKDGEQLVKDHPTPENYLSLSELYCRAGEFRKCLESAQKAIELRPGYVDAYNDAGAAYVSMGRLEEAIASVNKALQLDPDNKTAYFNKVQWERRMMEAGNAIMRK
jgi:Flp pilus assembly protein TadD